MTVELLIASGNMQYGHERDVDDLLGRPPSSSIAAAGEQLKGCHAMVLNEAASSGRRNPTRTLIEAAGLSRLVSEPYIHYTAGSAVAGDRFDPVEHRYWTSFGSGIALSSSASILDAVRRPLPITGEWDPSADLDLHMPRQVLAVTARLCVADARLDLTLVTAHLTPQRSEKPDTLEENEQQFKYLVGFAAQLPGVVVLAGDFNLPRDRPLASGELPEQVITAHGFSSSSVGPTHMRHDDIEVDYQMLRCESASGFSLKGATSCTLELPISDHKFISSCWSLEASEQ